jgi:hypothetical protein
VLTHHDVMIFFLIRQWHFCCFLMMSLYWFFVYNVDLSWFCVVMTFLHMLLIMSWDFLCKFLCSLIFMLHYTICVFVLSHHLAKTIWVLYCFDHFAIDNLCFCVSNIHLARQCYVLFNVMWIKLNSNMCWEDKNIQFPHVIIERWWYEKVSTWNQLSSKKWYTITKTI